MINTTQMENINTKTAFKVNVLYRGAEKWRYSKSINRAKFFQETAKKQGLCSIIYQKLNGKYIPI